MRVRMMAVGLLAALLVASCGGGSKQSATPTAAETPATVTATPTPLVQDVPLPCQGDAALCTFANQLTEWVLNSDIPAIVSGSHWDTANDRNIVEQSLANFEQNSRAPTQLLAIGCPFGPTGSPSCAGAFSLVFTNLPPGHRVEGTIGFLLFGFERKGPRPTLTGIASVTETPSREAAVNGGLTQQCGLSGTVETSEGGCTRTFFYPLGANGTGKRDHSKVLGINVEQWKVLDPADLPADVVLYVEKGCWGCEGPTTRVDRIYRSSDGHYHIEKVWPAADATTVGSFAMAPGGAEMYATSCIPGCSLFGQGDPNTTSAIYHSTDGGVSWTKVESLDGYAFIYATSEGWVLSRVRRDASAQDGWANSYERYPGHEPLSAPPGARAWARLTPAAPMLWQTPGGGPLVRVDGSVYLDPKLGDEAVSTYGVGIVGEFRSGAVAAAWFHSLGDNDIRDYLGIFESGALTRVVRGGRAGISPMFGGWSPAGAVYGNAMLVPDDLPTRPADAPPTFYGNIPVAFDFDKATITPLTLFGPLFASSDYWGRNIISGVITGPVARVSTGADCLNVRTEPGATSNSLGCFHDGVLLRLRGEPDRTAGSTTWRAVLTPDGQPGWASADFLDKQP